MDLYSLLGVARSASRDIIRKAFRAKIKTAHPDLGGDPVAFGQLMLAHDVLVDEERRETYDKTGSTEPPRREDYLRGVALGLLGELMGSILTADATGNPNTANLQVIGVEHLEKSIVRLEQQLAAIDKAQKRAKSMMGRWLGPREQENVLEGVLRAQDAHLGNSRANVLGQIQAYKLAITILKDHRFRYDQVNTHVTHVHAFYTAHPTS